jgi:hypothetical protein
MLRGIRATLAEVSVARTASLRIFSRDRVGREQNMGVLGTDPLRRKLRECIPNPVDERLHETRVVEELAHLVDPQFAF